MRTTLRREVARTDSFAGVERAEKNFLAAVNQWNEVYDLKRPASNNSENLDSTDVKILRLLDLMPIEELIALREDAAALEKRWAITLARGAIACADAK